MRKLSAGIIGLCLVLSGCIQGPAGEDGAQGPQGVQGPKGNTGEAGEGAEVIVLGGFLTTAGRVQVATTTLYYWTFTHSALEANSVVQVLVRDGAGVWANLTNPSYPAGGFAFGEGTIVINETSTNSRLTGFEYRIIIVN